MECGFLRALLLLRAMSYERRLGRLADVNALLRQSYSRSQKGPAARPSPLPESNHVTVGSPRTPGSGVARPGAGPNDQTRTEEGGAPQAVEDRAGRS